MTAESSNGGWDFPDDLPKAMASCGFKIHAKDAAAIAETASAGNAMAEKLMEKIMEEAEAGRLCVALHVKADDPIQKRARKVLEDNGFEVQCVNKETGLLQISWINV